MNVKALAAIVGTLSLASLATGCASTKSAEASAEKGAEAGCSGQKAAEEKGAEAGCSGQKQEGAAPAATPEKGAEGSCGAGSCSGKK
ncbi:hypothetical protein [Pyxidicoccus xibeiensis]|uniref:hypothetical protein n=1 Tax=Pyxidicoccus xibeiensis TaxID=2906759 RepID=UPI0020A78365|nr:hypothetical protein [Pyxidicoccus xibeiensis]MCP3143761.1 hypothetical protein [Pyxidicoccus xibeiensis]